VTGIGVEASASYHKGKTLFIEDRLAPATPIVFKRSPPSLSI
jgi:hypothetical protein